MSHPAISRWHLERTAFVYLRQSSPHQVKKNVEGAKRQRRMKQRVQELGWPEHQIQMLGSDTAKSGSSLYGRDDYQTMLQAVLAQQAGLICARELSRLVRDNQDWNQIVRLCRYQGVLLADEHRVYDPADPQDRVVLGIQGTFNEYELSLICDRMQRSRDQKAQRGELYESFPPGYICRQPPIYEKHPDPRVQRAVEKVFDDFRHAPSVLQLYRRLLQEGFQLPTVPPGKDWRDVEWTTPTYQRLVEMLRNPTYAGIYVRGKRKTVTRLNEEGHAQKKRQRLPREQWNVFLEDHHEPYISQATWERNMEKIAANAHMGQAYSKRSPQNGNGLMVGLLRCRRCGHKLHANYRATGVSYVCRGGGTQRDARGPSCFSFRAKQIEEQLAELVLEVVRPSGVAAATQAAERLACLHDQERQLIVDRLEASREIEVRAAREYKENGCDLHHGPATLGTGVGAGVTCRSERRRTARSLRSQTALRAHDPATASVRRTGQECPSDLASSPSQHGPQEADRAHVDRRDHRGSGKAQQRDCPDDSLGWWPSHGTARTDALEETPQHNRRPQVHRAHVTQSADRRGNCRRPQPREALHRDG